MDRSYKCYWYSFQIGKYGWYVCLVYASEADLLNVALFGITAKQWRDKHPVEKGNKRDMASSEQLVVLSNLEMLCKRGQNRIYSGRVELTDEASLLADTYIAEKVVGKTSLEDCRHIAIATINKVDVLASWNFKHIVNLDRIKGYNSVNYRLGYPMIEIRSPKDLIHYED